MDSNQRKKANFPNSPAPTRPPRTVDELNSGKNLIAKLNHVCLSKVLIHLPFLERLEMEKVCQKWKEAAELSWHSVKKLEFNELMITLDKREKTLEMIMTRCCQYLRHLTIIGNQYPWMSPPLKDNCQNIINFDIDINLNEDEYKISNENLIEIIKSMKQLKYLRLKIIYSPSSGNIINEIVDKLPQDIQEIHLLLLIDEEYGISPVLNRFNALHCLTLQGFKLTNETLEEGILQNKNTLSKLDLSYCKFPSCKSSIFTNLNNLEELILWEIGDLNVDEIISIAHNCLKLKYFEFEILDSNNGRPEDVPYRIFRELKYLNNLEHLKMYSNYAGDDNIISDIASNWKQLKHLNACGNWNFSVVDYREIIKFKNLEYLDFGYAKLDSQSFVNIASNCLKLKILETNFGEKPESALLELKNLKKIEKLNFFNCALLSGNFFSEIANNCKNLVDLNLNRCYNVTQASLIQFGKLENLKILDISWIRNVPIAMFDNFHKLEELKCHHCPSVSDESIKKVIDNCLKLKYLNVEATRITVESLIHASNRKFVFNKLIIWVDSRVKDDYKEMNSMPSPYLTIF